MTEDKKLLEQREKDGKVTDGGGPVVITIHDDSSKTDRTDASEVDTPMLEEGEKADAATKGDVVRWLKYTSLVVLVVQNSGQVLTMRYAKTRPQTQFLNTVAVFFGEVVKLIASLVLFFLSTKSVKESFSLLYKHFITDFFDTLKVGVPAFIYTIQNFLIYVAIENLDAGTYMVTYQLKILTTAFFTVVMMKRRLSVAQWLALVILVMGVAVVQISARQSKQASAVLANATTPLPLLNITQMGLAPTKVYDPENPIFGFFCVIVACFLSGFAGIYFEKVLKGSKVSLWLRNVQLASLSIPIGLGVIFVQDRPKVLADGFMQGFDWVVWSVVLLQALGGLVVAVVIKYADNILKGFATSIAIVVSCVVSIFLFNIIPTLLFIAGTVLVIGAVVLYSIFPYKKKPTSLVPESVAKAKDLDGRELKPIIKPGKH